MTDQAGLRYGFRRGFVLRHYSALLTGCWLVACDHRTDGTSPPAVLPATVPPVASPVGTPAEPKLPPPLDPIEIFRRAARSVVAIRTVGAQGSGVVIAPGRVLTNKHVVGPAMVLYQNDKRWQARLEWLHPTEDLATLSAENLDLPVAEQREDLVRVGERVYAIGAPQGFQLTLSDGLVSGLRRFGPEGSTIQTTAAISPGSSGGGLFDAHARLIGITTFGWRGGENMNFALPVSLALQTPKTPSASTLADAGPLAAPRGSDEERLLTEALSGVQRDLVQAEATRLLQEWDEGLRDDRARAANRIRFRFGLRLGSDEELACRDGLLPQCVAGKWMLGPGNLSREQAWQRLLSDAARVEVARMRIAGRGVGFEVKPAWCPRHGVESRFVESTWTRNPDLRLWLLFSHAGAASSSSVSNPDAHTFRR